MTRRNAHAVIERYTDVYNRDDDELYVQDIPDRDAATWMESQIPFFECGDKLIEDIYYFRWWVFRKHIKTTPEGRIITEFLPNVPWSGPFNSINCAAGHHIAEAQWLKDGTDLVPEYLRFWMQGSGDEYSYSSWLVDAAYRYALIRGDQATVTGLLDDFLRFYHHVESTNMTRYGLFWSYDDRDAMEMSISGSGLRPTLNSYMYANASAISHIAHWASNETLRRDMEHEAASLRTRINEVLWDDATSFYKVIPQTNRDDRIASLSFRDIPLHRNVREAIGYIPWMFGIPSKERVKAWNALTGVTAFAGRVGITTAEKNHPGYMRPNPQHECLWNGPSWPFATTQVLDAMIVAARDGRQVTADMFQVQLRRYAASHFRQDPVKGRVHWLDENMDADTGEWRSRDILESWGWPDAKGGVERGKDYNHSAFCDLIIRGLCGVGVEPNGLIRIEPLIGASGPDYFRLDGVTVRGRTLNVRYDRDGSAFGGRSGLTVTDGEETWHSDAPEPVIVIAP